MLGAGASQADLYRAAVAPVVEDVLSGYNGTIMAYGCTGAPPPAALRHEWSSPLPRSLQELTQRPLPPQLQPDSKCAALKAEPGTPAVTRQ